MYTMYGAQCVVHVHNVWCTMYGACTCEYFFHISDLLCINHPFIAKGQNYCKLIVENYIHLHVHVACGRLYARTCILYLHKPILPQPGWKYMYIPIHDIGCGIHYLDHRCWCIECSPSPPGSHTLALEFRVKFYVTDPSRLQEEITRYQFYLQLKKDLITNK